jgi:RNA-splicing ligase RtcB
MEKKEDMMSMTIIYGKCAMAKVFTEDIENSAYEQIQNLCNQPLSQDARIRVMPDVHAGAGCVIGLTMKITDKVIPNFVGVDIGCGVDVVALGADPIDFSKLDDIVHNNIPSGKNVRSKEAVPEYFLNLDKLHCKNSVNMERAMLSVGTLGGGNHFISVETSEQGQQFLLIHTGSRHMGKQIADYYTHMAQKNLLDTSAEIKKIIKTLQNEGRITEISEAIKNFHDNQPTRSEEFAFLEGNAMMEYLEDMEIAQNYAKWNRRIIANTIVGLLGLPNRMLCSSVHNYIDMNTMILRKGAIMANENTPVIIPLNMRDGSILATGIGNDDWNNSSPHGAGRTMSRRDAKRTLNMDEYKDSMKDIYSSCISESTLDEAPKAYKNADSIIEAIDGITVRDLTRIYPVYNFKAEE